MVTNNSQDPRTAIQTLALKGCLREQPDAAKVKVLYIGGWGRSGSTLVDRILGQVDGFFPVGELRHIWDRCFVKNQLCGCGKPFKECSFWRAVVNEAFGGWEGVDVEYMLHLEQITDRARGLPYVLKLSTIKTQQHEYVRVLSSLYRAIQKVSGDRVIVDSSKNPLYAYMLSRIGGIDMRLVHLIRDSRGVAFSWAKKMAVPDIPGDYMIRYGTMQSAVRWSISNILFETMRFISPNYLLVRYEDLVRNPLRELQRILIHSGEPAGTELCFINNHEVNLEPSHTVAGNPVRFQQGKLLLRLDEEWREKMGKSRRNLVSLVTWPFLVRYGYPVISRPSEGHRTEVIKQ